jgi:hypothetical protein
MTMLRTRRPSSHRLCLAALVLAASAPQQVAMAQRAATIDPGMTRDQVVGRLGEPSTESHAGSFTYLFYDNDCAQTCGIDDLVVLERNTVTDAIFRSPRRSYSGISSSPQALAPVPADHFGPEPLRASTADDRAHRGGIVFMGPRAPLRAPQYIKIVPNHADSARWVGSMTSPRTAAGPPSGNADLHASAVSPQ